MPMKGSETRCFCSFSLAILVKHCMSFAWGQNSSTSIIRLDAVWHLILKSGRWQTGTQCINRNSWWRLPYRPTWWILTIFINFPSSQAAKSGWQTGTLDREGLGSNYWPLLDSGHSFSVVIIMLLARELAAVGSPVRTLPCAGRDAMLCPHSSGLNTAGEDNPVICDCFYTPLKTQPWNLVHHLLRYFVWSRMKVAATLRLFSQFQSCRR